MIEVRLEVSSVDWKTTVVAPQSLAVQICHVDDACVSESASEYLPAVSVGASATFVAVLAGELFVGVTGFVFVVPVSKTWRV